MLVSDRLARSSRVIPPLLNSDDDDDEIVDEEREGGCCCGVIGRCIPGTYPGTRASDRGTGEALVCRAYGSCSSEALCGIGLDMAEPCGASVSRLQWDSRTAYIYMREARRRHESRRRSVGIR